MGSFHTDDIIESVNAALENLPDEIGGLHETLHDAMGGMGAGRPSVTIDGMDIGVPSVTVTGDTFDKQFEVGPAAKLSIHNAQGLVRIRADDVSSIRVHAEGRHAATRHEGLRIEFSHDGDRVFIKTKARHGMTPVAYDITVPRDCEVRAKSLEATIEIEGVRAPVAVQTLNGDVKITGLGGKVDINSVNGDVSGSGVSGEIWIRATSADVRLMRSHVSGFHLSTVSGDLVIETPLTPGVNYFAKTVSGDLVLRVPVGTAATVQLKSTSGTVVSELPAEIIRASRRSWQGRINGGGANVEMTSVSGDLRIAIANGGHDAPDRRFHEHAPEAPVPPVPPVPPAPPTPPAAGDRQETTEELTSDETDPDTAAVLAALERGEITVDEAMEKLDSMR